jgi:hypothetical protein
MTGGTGAKRPSGLPHGDHNLLQIIRKLIDWVIECRLRTCVWIILPESNHGEIEGKSLTVRMEEHKEESGSSAVGNPHNAGSHQPMKRMRMDIWIIASLSVHESQFNL